MAYTFAGKGYKRTQLNLNLNRISLNNNPVRHPDLKFSSEEEAVKYYLDNSDLSSLIYSMATHGYFDEEPIVAVPEFLPDSIKNLNQDELMWSEEYVLHIHNPDNTFVVIEGNRRLAAVKALMDGARVYPEYGLPEVPEHIMFDLSIIPSIIYTTEKEVLPYLYVRHCGFDKKWTQKEIDSFEEKMTNFGHDKEYIELFKS